MKNLTLLFSALLLVLISCNSNGSKQTLSSSSENIPDSIIIEKSEMKEAVKSGHSEENEPLVLDNAVYHTVTQDNDTIIYEVPVVPAALENAVAYFRTNNKYKNWNKDDKKLVILKCIAEKDGSISSVRVLRDGSGNSNLDNEAIRLIKQAKLTPARDAKDVAVRSLWTTVVRFPPE